MHDAQENMSSASFLSPQGMPWPSAVIFDMDGTLVATTEADFLAWQKLFYEFGTDLSYEGYFPLLGRKSQDVVEHILGLEGEVAQRAMARKMELFAEIVRVQGIQVMPHAEDFLDTLAGAGIPMALATSSRKRKMQLVMQDTGLGKYFPVMVAGEEVETGKPHPGIFLLAADKLGADPWRCLVLEDTSSGIAAAKSAGMKCIAIVSTHEAKDLGQADHIIRDFSELSLDLLANCMGR
jgi:beta-phosphoglucomutase family hydrolase